MTPAVARADLLRVLHAVRGDADRERMALQLGFAPVAPPPPAPVVIEATGRGVARGVAEQASAPAPAPAAATPDPRQPPLRAHLNGVVRLRTFEPAESATQPPDPSSGEVPELQPGPLAPLRFEPLVRPARLWPAFVRSLGRQRDAGLDVHALTLDLAQAQPIRRLPRRRRQCWPGNLWVLIDSGDAMSPYMADIVGLVDRLLRQRGKAGLTVWWGRDIPRQFDRWTSLARPAGLTRIDRPPPGATMLALSHLGILARNPEVGRQWQAWGHSVGAAGGRIVAWMPMSARCIQRDLVKIGSMHCLQAAGSLRAPRAAPMRGASALPDGLGTAVDELLTLAACCTELQPDLLRALRHLDPILREEPALEGLAWTAQPWVREDHVSRNLSEHGIGRLRPGFKELSAAVQQQVLRVMQRSHRGFSPHVEATEVLIWRDHARPEALTPEIEARIRWAEWFLHRFVDTADDAAAAGVATDFARDLLIRQGTDRTWMAGSSALLARLHALAGLHRLPEGLDAAQVTQAWAARARSVRRDCMLYEHRGALWIDLARPMPAPSPGRSAYLQFRASQLAVAPDGRAAWVQRVGEAPLRLVELADRRALPVRLEWDGGSAVVDQAPRPHWALEWARDAKGLYALAPTPWGAPARIDCVAGADGVRFVADSGAVSRNGLVVRNDPKFGVLAELRVRGEAGEVVQRLRWLPPGEFWMGSIAAERALLRNKDYEEWARNESPRHRVRLTSGFWLADTACTQALWLAVMGGKNPSRFTGDPNLPVENVSFDDVQAFLKRLQALLPPGCEAGLPTESQWEYACRAGKETAFSFGDRITPEEVNYHGNDLFGDAPKGLYRERTVPVASLPPNAWGLYEMHGNVWEWCDDGLRQYGPADEAEPAIDPTGPREQGPEAHRAVRGGSWIFFARLARSACRYDSRRDDRDDFLGFRLALRSTSPVVPEGPASKGISSPGPEAPDKPARRDDGPARGLFDRLRGLLPGGDASKPRPGDPAKPKRRR